MPPQRGYKWKIIIYTAEENDYGNFWKASILPIGIKRVTSSIQERKSALILYYY